MDQHYRGDIRVGREFIAVRCVGNFIRKRRKQKLVADIYVDGGTRGSRICLVDKSENKTIVKTRGGDPTNNEMEYLALLFALDFFSLLTAVPSAEPMAVASPAIPISICSKKLDTIP